MNRTEEQRQDRRWRPRKVLAALVRAAIFAVPLATGFAAGAFVARVLAEPEDGLGVILWWMSVITVASGVATLTDRLARRLLPLTVLLRMTMLFPDRAPSRLQVARRSGRVAQLKRRIVEAEQGGDADAGEMAELILSLAAALSSHDRKTRGHSERTRAYTDMIAEEMRLPQLDRDKLRWAALLHDVGKLDVPTEILNKNGKLSDEEWQLVKRHPIQGMKLIGPLIPWLGEWAKTIEHHHERWDGSGYPHGLARQEIALGARIVSVADAYDVMTTGRSYQRAKTPAQARREIAALAGIQFDPLVARALLNVSLGRLRWATGPLAVLAEIPFLRGLPQVGRDVATVLTSSALMATTLVGGVLPNTGGLSPFDLAREVVAGSELDGEAGPEEQAGGGGGNGEGAGGAGPGRTTSTTSTTSLEAAASTTTTVSRTGTTAGSSSGTSTTASTSTTSTTRPTSTTTSTTTTITTTTTTTAPASSAVANDDGATVTPGSFSIIDVLANDSGTLVQSSVAILSPPSTGSVSLVGGSGKIRYDAPADLAGSVSFTYQVCASDGTCDSATVVVTAG